MSKVVENALQLSEIRKNAGKLGNYPPLWCLLVLLGLLGVDEEFNWTHDQMSSAMGRIRRIYERCQE